MLNQGETIQLLLEGKFDESKQPELIQYLLDSPLRAQIFSKKLPTVSSARIVALLKEQADKHWSINPHISLACAEKIISIAQAQQEKTQLALGKMARGDALKFIGNNREAWDALLEAGALYLEAQNDFGWARTCIGKLWLSTELAMSVVAFEDARKAQAVFESHKDHKMLMRLYWNWAGAHNHLGNYDQAISLYQKACEEATASEPPDFAALAPLYSNIGYSYLYMGKFKEAESYFSDALNQHIEAGQNRSIVIEKLNLAKLAQLQGEYQHALDLLYQIEHSEHQGLEEQKSLAKRQISECYLELNRNKDARQLALQAIAGFETQAITYRGTALALLCLAEAESKLGNHTAAIEALNRAESIYSSQAASGWLAVVQIRRAESALADGNLKLAMAQAEAALLSFAKDERRADEAEAQLLRARVYLARQDFENAALILNDVLLLAREMRLSKSQYLAHLLLAQIHEKSTNFRQAIAHYEAAIAILEQSQGQLLISLQLGFLQRPTDAFHGLIRIYRTSGDLETAFNTLERMKAQTLLAWV